MLFILSHRSVFFFFFNDTATTEIYTLSLHDALPIRASGSREGDESLAAGLAPLPPQLDRRGRSEEHTSELQSRVDLVCRLLLEKTKTICLHLLSSNKKKNK